MKNKRHIIVGVIIVAVPVCIGVFIALFDNESTVVSQNSKTSGDSVLVALKPAERSTPEKPLKFEWKILKTFDVKTGDVPSELRSFNNEYIRIPGFVVPLEDNAGRVTEFLLVPTQMSCVHVPPPPPNFIFFVNVINKAGIDAPRGPVWLTGQLAVGKASVRGESYFLRIEAVKVEPYRAEGK